MSYYLIFDKMGRFKGYTKDKKLIDKFKEQRKKRNRFEVKKVNKDFFTKKMKKVLVDAVMEVIEHHDVVLLQEEYEDISMEATKIFVDIYRTLDGFLFHVTDIVFTKEEAQVIGKFMDIVSDMVQTIELGLCTDEDRIFSQCFKSTDIVMKVMRLV